MESKIREHINQKIMTVSKKLLQSIFVFVAMISLEDVNAQTTVSILSAADSAYHFCPLPAQLMVGMYIQTTGYNHATDFMTVKVYWGDGNDTTATGDLQDGGSVQYLEYVGPTAGCCSQPVLTHNYSLSGTYTPLLIVTGPDGNADTMFLNPVTFTEGCSTNEGYTYVDNNSNCVFDAGDDTLSGIMVRISDAAGTLISAGFSNEHGYYNISVPSGLSGLTITAMEPFMYGTAVCPAGGSVTFTSGTLLSTDFAIACSATTGIYFASSTSNHVGPAGSYGQITAGAFLFSCTNSAATVTLTLDPKVSFTGMISGPSPTSVAGNVLTWNTTLAPWGGYTPDFYATVEIYTDPSTTLFDNANFTVSVTGPLTNPHPEYETITYTEIVGGPFDPNSKEVLPQGIGATGNVPPDQDFTYTLNFQNTGTAPAINVYLIDTLDTNLELNSFQLIGSSHAVSTSINGSIIKFNFPLINLPDSGSNEPGSHGWVTYHIKSKSGLANGTQIKNTGYIYFDYNAPIVTNTTLNTIDMTLNTQEAGLSQNKNLLYPNPANTNFTVQFEKPVTGILYLVDAMGKMVKQVQLNLASLVVVSTNDLENGFYAITVPGVELKQNRVQVVK